MIVNLKVIYSVILIVDLEISFIYVLVCNIKKIEWDMNVIISYIIYLSILKMVV